VERESGFPSPTAVLRGARVWERRPRPRNRQARTVQLPTEPSSISGSKSACPLWRDVSLTEADRAYLKALETWLDMYPEMRTTE